MSVRQLQQPEVKREKTAIVRFRHSKPVLLALSHSIIESSTSVFDYGCGRGEDIKYLRSQGIQASGWDPHYQPYTSPATADVVNLGYVLNVIEDPFSMSVEVARLRRGCTHVEWRYALSP